MSPEVYQFAHSRFRRYPCWHNYSPHINGRWFCWRSAINLIEYYRLSGQAGLTFVLVHGSWADAHFWDGVSEVLRSQGHTVYTPEYAGHGSDPNKNVTHAMITKSVVDFIMGLNLHDIVLVGHSFGGLSRRLQNKYQTVLGGLFSGTHLYLKTAKQLPMSYPLKRDRSLNN